jgi:hypothetical protein
VTRLEDLTRKPRVCAWCGDEIAPRMRKGTRSCSKRCRQSLSRFRVAPAGSTAAKPMRFAYADPPYPEKAERYYGASEVDHEALLHRLVWEYPDGWALSTSSSALPMVCEIALSQIARGDRNELRIAAWCKGARRGTSYRPRDAWEPLLVFRGRPALIDAKTQLDNALVLSGNTRHLSLRTRIIGTKPPGFCEWMFRQLGAQRGDVLHDLFPGSGSVSRSWDLYTAASRRAGATRREVQS